MTHADVWCIYDVNAGKKLVELKNVLRLDENAFSPDCERIVGMNQYFQFAGFEVRTGKQLYTLEFPRQISDVEFIDNGKLRIECFPNYQFEADPNTGKALQSIEFDPLDESSHKPHKIKIWNQLGHYSIPESLPFHDGRSLKPSFGQATILDLKEGKDLCTFGDIGNHRSLTNPLNPMQWSMQWSGDYEYAILDEGRRVMISEIGKYVKIYRNRRPERWWGAAWLLEFWLALGFFALFVWSITRDWRTLGQKESAS